MLEIASPFQADFSRLGLDSFEAISRRFLPGGLQRKTVVVVNRHTIALANGSQLDVFFKQYEFASPCWRFMARASKARHEFKNYAVFLKLNVPCAEAIAFGEHRDFLGRLCRAFIITRAIPDAPTLVDRWQALSADLSDRTKQLRMSLCLQLAELTSRMHGANFFHHDLVWRNILVTTESSGKPKLWLIDCPRGAIDSWSPLRRRKMLKDLASLDKSAAKFCTLRERLTFLSAYLAGKGTKSMVKSLARDVVEYRRTRWPEDWQGV